MSPDPIEPQQARARGGSFFGKADPAHARQAIVNAALLRRKLSHLGPLRTLAHYAARTLHHLARAQVMWVLCLEPASAVPPNLEVSGLEFGMVEDERLRREARDPGSGLTPEGVEAEIAKGDACYGAFVDGALASYLFVAEGPTELPDGVVVDYDPSWSFSRWAFTRPEYRGLHLHSALKAHALENVVRRGRHGILSLVSATNFESLHAGGRLGCHRVGLVAAARLGGHERVWMGRGCRDYGLSLNAPARLALAPGGASGAHLPP
jgi:GNAT superfamily N-acetyltransferase